MKNSSLGNKEVFSKNLQNYIEKSGKDRKELAKIWGFPYSTLTEWLNAKKYPRIDKIELMANYFGIMKSDLIEKKDGSSEIPFINEKNNDLIAKIVVRMNEDIIFAEVVSSINEMDTEQLSSLKNLVAAFKK